MPESIATAYVQIIPTTEGIGGELKKQLGMPADNAGKEAGTKAGGGFAKTMLKAIASAGIAKGVGDFVKGAVDAGGALQQSIGGIETLFKNDADTMVKYANDAWQTVGISANDYMENVTSFSASLLQGLGGDTEKAAEVANMAMIDMGDNANKFGTDMGAIQNAYQGFAKQNYTMLDNLKLGYGGTKTEMERLLKDAQAISGVEYDINNLSDVYEAIHVVQEELGVTGTTAREASTTLAGASGAMKASWENLQGAMATGTGVSEALEALGSSVVVYLRNLLPMIGNVLSRLPGMLITLVREIGTSVLDELKAIDFVAEAEAWVDGVTEFIGGEGLEEMLTTLTGILSALMTGLSQSLPIMMPAIVELLSYIVQTLIAQAPMLLQAGLELLNGIAQGLVAALPVLIAQLPLIIQAIIDAIATGMPMILTSAGDIIAALGNGLINALPVLMQAVPQILNSIINYFTINFPQIVQQGVKVITSLASGLAKAMPQIIKAVGSLLKSIISTLAQGAPSLRNAGVTILNTIKNGLLSVLGSLGSIGLDIVRGIWSGISNAAGWLFGQIRNFASNLVSNLKAAMKIGSPSKVMEDEIGRWIPAGIAVGIEDNAGLISQAMSGLRTDMQAGFTPQFYQSLSYDGAATPAGGTSTIMVNIYATPNQSADDLYNTFERRLTNSVLRKEAAFA